MSIAWLFDGLKSEPYGLLPLTNLKGKGSASVKNYRQLASYNWVTDETLAHPTITIPGEPRQQMAWIGGKIPPDTEAWLFDANHAGMPKAPMDPIFRILQEKGNQSGTPFDFQQYDLVTDCITFQKLFAFCKGDVDGGLFRMDVERVGKTAIITRVEGGDFIPADPDFPSYEVALKNICTRARSPITSGPFQQISEYEFGTLKVLVRFQAEFAEYSEEDWLVNPEEVGDEVKKSEKSFSDSNLHYINYGSGKKHNLSLMAAYPTGKGLPMFLWPGLYFSGADKLLLCWYKGNGDFSKPASYAISDMNKLIKPLPYTTVTKVHDALVRVVNFLRKCDEDVRISLVWQGFPHIEMYERSPDQSSGISDQMREYLKSQRESGDPVET